jgi:hypothetical protein
LTSVDTQILSSVERSELDKTCPVCVDSIYNPTAELHHQGQVWKEKDPEAEFWDTLSEVPEAAIPMRKE